MPKPAFAMTTSSFPQRRVDSATARFDVAVARHVAPRDERQRFAGRGNPLRDASSRSVRRAVSVSCAPA